MKSTSFDDKGRQTGRQVIPLYDDPPQGSAPRGNGNRGIWQRVRNWMAGQWMKITQHYLQAVENGQIDLTPSAMQTKFGFLVNFLFHKRFDKLPATEVDMARIRSYRERGALVYVMYNRSRLDYLYFNHLFLHTDLPLAQFANGVDISPMLSVPQYLKNRIAQYFYRRNVGPIPDPMDGDRLAELVQKRQPVLLFLTRSKALMSTKFGFSTDPLLTLVELQKKVDFPIYVVPQLIIWQHRPGTLKEKTFVETVFGDPDSPGYLRKLVHFFTHFRFAQVKFGDAIDLRAYLENAKSPSLLEEARRIRWVLRHYLYRERKAMHGPQERHRNRIIARIERHVELQSAILQWAQRTGKTIEEGKALARKYILEIVPDRSWSMVAGMDYILRGIWKTFYKGVIIDEAQLDRVRKSAKDHPVVYVASHKSHMDYMAISSALYRNEVVLPYICAGINLNFWPMGPLFKRLGAYFIRRSYPEPDIYPAVLNRYVRELMSAGQAQMFFIEGGRSRTGKLLRPKMGILSKVVEGFQANVTKDVMIVPVYAGYDRVLEEKSYSDEASGGEKPKEDLGALFLFFRKLFRSRYGKIYVYFDEPISLADYLKDNNASGVLRKLASRICFSINRVSVVFPAAMVALILLSHRKRSLSRVELSERAQPLIRYLERRKVRFSDVFFNREYAVESALQLFNESGLVKSYKEDDFHFYTVDESKRLQLNFYKNNIIHFFVSFSLLSITILACERKKGEGNPLDLGEIERTYEFLRTLFEGEFYFRPKEALPAYVRNVLDFFEEQNDLEIKGDTVLLTPAGKKALTSHQEIVYNFLETYAVALLVLLRNVGKVVEEKELLKQSLNIGRRLYVQGRLERIESLSKFTLLNAFHTFGDRALMTKDARKGFWLVTADEAAVKAWSEPLKELMHEEFFA